jgi:hypothetical protein
VIQRFRFDPAQPFAEHAAAASLKRDAIAAQSQFSTASALP